MKLEIPGQLRGKDAGRVMPVAIKLGQELEPAFASLGEETLTLISAILRIGGELGTFGADGIENFRVADKKAKCDVVVDARDWCGMSEDQISSLVCPQILNALTTLLAEAGFDPVPEFLRK